MTKNHDPKALEIITSIFPSCNQSWEPYKKSNTKFVGSRITCFGLEYRAQLIGVLSFFNVFDVIRYFRRWGNRRWDLPNGWIILGRVFIWFSHPETKRKRKKLSPAVNESLYVTRAVDARSEGSKTQNRNEKLSFWHIRQILKFDIFPIDKYEFEQKFRLILP